MTEIGTSKQLFLDDQIIQNQQGIAYVLHQPAKYAGNPLMYPLYPWEGRLSLYGTVMRDPDDPELLRMWYTGYGGMGVLQMSGSGTSKWAHLGFDPSNLLYSYCYATSRDGIFWDRPNLSLVEYEGKRDNNIVMSNASSGQVVYDARDPDPDRRYKALFFENREKDGTSNEGDGFSVAFSPDGLRWEKYEGNPVSKRASDAHTLLGWDDISKQYVAYARPSLHEGNKTRRIGRAVSNDFNAWTDPTDVLVPNEEDPPGLEFYGMPVFRYQDFYVGLLYAYHAPPEEPQIRFYGKVDVQLASSRNGVDWNRVCERKPFIPNGPPNSIDAGEIYAASAPLVVDDELWFYYSPTEVQHGATGRSGGICLAKLRLDGFVSADAVDEKASLVTVLFDCEGGELEINAVARNGEISIAILDSEGMEISGFARAHSAIFDGDAVRHRATWKDASYDSLRGRQIRIKFYLRNASLYAFRQTGRAAELNDASRISPGF